MTSNFHDLFLDIWLDEVAFLDNDLFGYFLVYGFLDLDDHWFRFLAIAMIWVVYGLFD
jgi:hypothetical protein